MRLVYLTEEFDEAAHQRIGLALNRKPSPVYCGR
jgi:hypothetical protein